MTGKYVKTTSYSDVKSEIIFIYKKNGYNFISRLMQSDDDQIFGRFDFNFGGSSILTNKGLKAIIENKDYALECIEKLFDLGVEYIEIEAAKDKQSKRLSLYRRLLSHYNIVEYNESLFAITK